MSFLASILLLTACGRDPLADLPALPIDQSGTVAVSLTRAPATLKLPASNQPPCPEGQTCDRTDGRFPISGFTRAPRREHVFSAALPFKPGNWPSRYPPPIRVFQGEKELPWTQTFAQARGGDGAWRLDRGELHLYLDDAPGDDVTVVNDMLRKQLDRLEFGRSGLKEPEYAKYEVTTGDVTRSGLLLPAPSTADWTVAVPKTSPVFRAYLGIVPSPLSDAVSDGVTAVLEVVDGADVTEVASQAISPPKDKASDLAPWDVDLSAYAGKQVDLRVEMRPGATSTYDYAFLGSPVVTGTPTAKPRRVVVVAVDTLRPDHLGSYGYDRATSPELDKLAAQSIVFDHTWSAAPRTRPSFRTATTGRWPLDAVGARSVGDVFSAHGFATAGIAANIHLNPRFKFNEGYDLWWLDPAATADTQVDRGLAWLTENKERDTFLFLHIMDPHLFYVPPPPYRDRFVTDPDPTLPPQWNRWQVYGWMRRGTLTERRKANMMGLYDGEIAWTDSQIGRFLDGLDKLGGTTLVVFHTDHGEEFWDHGGYEHNHSLYDELVRTAMWFRPPGGVPGGKRISMPASLVDLAPTLFSWAGFKDDLPPTDGIDLKPYADGTADPSTAPDRPLAVGYLRYDVERWGVVLHHHKYVLFTGSGREELYDLDADPKEQDNLAASTDLTEYRQAMMQVHHGLVVAPGWRIEVAVNAAAGPVTVHLPAPCVLAGVIDPDSLSEHPANEEWGEKPEKLPAEVGAVAVSDDKTTLTFTPGTDPSGILYVTFADTASATNLAPLTLERGGKPLPAQVNGGRATWRDVGERMIVTPGTVAVPPLDEAERMAQIAGQDAKSGDLDLLRSLGYIGGGDGDEAPQ